MQKNFSEAKIMDVNAMHFGVNLESQYKKAGELISEKLIKDYGNDQRYVVICGLGGNAGDGFSVALHLGKKGVKMVEVYLVGRAALLENPQASLMWEKLYSYYKGENPVNLYIKQDCYTTDIPQGDVIVEALVGTGLEGAALNKRFHDVIKRISHFDSILVAIDVPVPHYSPDKTYSLIYPKTEDAVVIKLDLPHELSLYTGPGEVEALVKPKKHSHKSKNGKMFVVHNTDDIEAIKQNVQIAKEYETYVHVLNLNLNVGKDLNKILANFDNYEIIPPGEEDVAIQNSDVLMLGKFDHVSLVNRAVINETLKYKALPCVLYDSAINYIDPTKLKKRLAPNLLILNRDQLNQILVSEKSSIEMSTKRCALVYNLNVITLGTQSILYNPRGEFKIATSLPIFEHNFNNKLATKIASFSTLNDIWLSMRAASAVIIPR